MEWWVILLIITGILMGLFAIGIPVALAFLVVNIIGFYLWVGGIESVQLLVPSAFAGIATFTLVTVPLYIFMGVAIFRTGLGRILIDNIGVWMGRIPASLSLVCIASGTLFAMMSGSSVSGVAMLGSTLVPEMRIRGYQSQMVYAPLLAAGTLATVIPPSIYLVIIATFSLQSVADLLLAGVIPGVILAGMYFCYILARARLQPHLAPTYGSSSVDWRARAKALLVILPFSLVIFLVLGVVFLGVATPSEGAALGATGILVLAAAYRRLTWRAIKTSLMDSVSVTGMVFLITMSAVAFGQLLAFTGVAQGLAKLAIDLPVAPIVVVIAMLILLVIMGCFVENISLMMITVPLFFPVIRALGYDPVWFSILMLITIETALITPPFGLLLFTLKGIDPDSTLADIYRGVVPIFLLLIMLLILLLVFPGLVTWLPAWALS